MSERVVVFLDYQNVYKGARSYFHKEHDSHTGGQIDPLKLAQLLVADSPFDRVLQQVRLYRGLPSSSLDPKGFGACSSQCAAWSSDPRVSVTLRPLSYPVTWLDRPRTYERPREKGIDVALAIDFVVMAVRGEYDVGILMSTDTDLKPAIEAVATMTATEGIRAETAAWKGSGKPSSRLGTSSGSRRIWCHWLDQQAYSAVSDDTNYS